MFLTQFLGVTPTKIPCIARLTIDILLLATMHFTTFTNYNTHFRKCIPFGTKLFKSSPFWPSLLKHPHIAKHRLGPTRTIPTHQKPNHPRSIRRIRKHRHNQLLIHIEPELRPCCHNQKSIGGTIAALNGARRCPVDQREPVERVVADGAYKTILTPAVDLQHIKLAIAGIETEDQAVD